MIVRTFRSLAPLLVVAIPTLVGCGGAGDDGASSTASAVEVADADPVDAAPGATLHAHLDELRGKSFQLRMEGDCASTDSTSRIEIRPVATYDGKEIAFGSYGGSFKIDRHGAAAQEHAVALDGNALADLLVSKGVHLRLGLKVFQNVVNGWSWGPARQDYPVDWDTVRGATTVPFANQHGACTGRFSEISRERYVELQH
ncbi:MAG: hypothetical protein U0169_23075 [Polyangiaceae bacterium]